MKKELMKRLVVAGLLGMFYADVSAQDAQPGWWTNRNVLTASPINDFGVVNQGQLKWIARQAWLEFSNLFEYAAVSNVGSLVVTFNTSTNDFAPANIGQLKHVAQPYYDVLIAAGYRSGYPWTSSLLGSHDYALANIGQVKNTFSFELDFSGDLDRDGLPDRWELQYLKTIRNTADQDRDNDGLINFYEWLNETDPANPDTDGDGLKDGFEVLYNFNPLSAPGEGEGLLDSDGDGLNNIAEQLHGTHPRLADTDGDGMPDKFEVDYGLNSLNPGDAFGDLDGDGVLNVTEAQNGTNPRNSDTDGDGLSDFAEIQTGGNPTNASANTVLGRIWINTGIQPGGAFTVSVSFNTNALRILSIGSSGAMVPYEYSAGGSGTAIPVKAGYLQTASTNGLFNVDAVSVLFGKTGTPGMATEVSVTLLEAVHSGSGTNLTGCSAGITGIPSVL